MNAFAGPDGQEDMPYLLLAGPVTTVRAVRFAMLADYGPHEEVLLSSVRLVQRFLLAMTNSSESHDCLLLPGPGALGMEAVLGSLCPARRKKTLVIVNGPQGVLAKQVLERLGRPHIVLEYRDGSLPRGSDVAKTLKEDAAITHVWMAHVDAGTGMLNPVAEVGEVVKGSGRVFMLDATLSLGGVAIDAAQDNVDVIVGSSDCALESVPGVSFVLLRKELLESPLEPASALLDLRAHHAAQTQGTAPVLVPPSHPLVALREALQVLEAEGGVAARNARYVRLSQALRERLAALGFSLFLKDADASPLVHTVLAPRAATYDFERFRTHLRQRGFAIDGGLLQSRPSFRVGCMGQLSDTVIMHFISALEDTMKVMELASLAPAQA